MLTSPPWPFIGSCTRVIANERYLHWLRAQVTEDPSVCPSQISVSQAAAGRDLVYKQALLVPETAAVFFPEVLRISCTEQLVAVFVPEVLCTTRFTLAILGL